MISFRPVSMPPPLVSKPLPARLLWVVMLMLAFLAPSRRAFADNYQHATACTGGVASITVPNVTIANPNIPTGSLLGNPGTAVATFNCPNSGKGNPWQYYYNGTSSGTPVQLNSRNWPYLTSYPNISIQGMLAGSPVYNSSLGGLLYPTNLSGVSLLLTSSPDPIQSSGGTLVTINQGTTTAQVTFTAQLVKTGTLGTGTVTSVPLMTFENYTSGDTVSTPSYGSLTLNSITVTLSTCKVTASGSGTVTLPDVWQSALASSGKVAGATSFTIAVSGCGSTFNKVQTFFSSNSVDTATGNLKNTTGTGYAGKVEVQLLDGQNGNAAIDLNTTSETSQTATAPLSNGGATLNYQARYYATGAATAGAVKSTAQFTMVYQ